MSFPILNVGVLATMIALCGCGNTKVASSDRGDGKAAIAAQDVALLAIHQIKPRSTTPIRITSSAFRPGAEIPYTYADYGDKISPQLSWTGVPNETKSLVILMEDPDAKEPKPFIHWVLYNLPPETAALPESVPAELQLVGLSKARQGRNSRGSIGYFGPRPPYVDPAHHYHFQIFALDQMLDLLPGADRDTVLKAMQGHTLASGELIGAYKAAK